MKVVVTGGSGRIGHLVCLDLARHEYEVVNATRSAPREPQPGVTFVQANTSDMGELVSAFAGADAVMHIAAIPNPMRNPAHVVFNENTEGTYNVCEACFALGIGSVIYASSINHLGLDFRYRDVTPDYFPVDEEHRTLAQDPYALSKVASEEILHGFHRRSGMRTIIIRPPAVILPDQYQQRCAANRANPLVAGGFLWTYVDARDLATLFRLALEQTDLQDDVIYGTAEDAWAERPLAELVPQYFAQAGNKAAHMTGDDAGVTNAKAKRLLGFKQQYYWRDLVK
ncbi:MAG: NAD-dependent epimerase/dehydratase family protein [Thermomicrobiales bacterium]